MLTEAQVKDILTDSLPEIKKAMIAEVKNQLANEIRYSLNEPIKEAVKVFIAAEITPALKAHLVSEREGLIAVAIKAGDEIVVELVKSLVAATKENLSSSYSRNEIFKKLFD